MVTWASEGFYGIFINKMDLKSWPLFRLLLAKIHFAIVVTDILFKTILKTEFFQTNRPQNIKNHPINEKKMA